MTAPLKPKGARITRNDWRWEELLFWALVAASAFVFPGHLPLISQVIIFGIFAMSLDLLIGYTGIASLGHAVFFGIGAYTAGYLSQAGYGEPISGLGVAAVMAGATGLLASFLVVRLRGIALLVVTLGLGLLFFELAGRLRFITGGEDGLQNIETWPLLGLFPFDFRGVTATIYAFVAGATLYIATKYLSRSNFGLALEAVRENEKRASAIGIPVRRVQAMSFIVSAAIAGVAGALYAQTMQYVALDVINLDRSVGALIMVVLGGLGTLLGGLIGAAIYITARDILAALDPVYWNFWLGTLLFVVVWLGRGGVLGLLKRLKARFFERLDHAQPKGS